MKRSNRSVRWTAWIRWAVVLLAVPLASCRADGYLGNLAPADTNPARPGISVNGEGGAMAVWNEGRDLLARRYVPGVGWEEALVVTTRERAPEAPSVAMTGGDALMVWEERDDGHSLAYYAGAGWDTTSTAIESSDLPASDLRVESSTFARPGTIFTAWGQVVSPTALRRYRSVQSRRFFPNQTLLSATAALDTSPQQRGDKPQNTFGARLAADGNGRAIVVWAQAETVNGAILPGILAARFDGARWTDPVIIGSGARGASQPDVAMDREGNALAVWVEDEEIHAAGYDVDDDAWRPDTRLSDGSRSHRAPRVALNDLNVGVVTWEVDLSGAAGGIHAVRYVSGAGFQSDIRIDVTDAAGNRLGGRRPVIGTDRFRNARVVWEAGGRICTAEYVEPDGWKFAEVLGPGERPDFAMDGNGLAIAVWWDGGFREKVWDPLGPVAPPPATGSIAFASDRDGDFEIFTAAPDGRNLFQLTSNDAVDRDPAWSPDGRWIAFVSDRDGQVFGNDLYVMEVATGDVTRRTYIGADGGDIMEPAWSPDQTRIAVSTPVRFADGGIFVIELATGSFRPVTQSLNDRGPAWSPDGSRIAFARDGDILAVDPDGSPLQIPEALTDRASFDASPSWGRLGRLLLASDTGIQIYDMHQMTEETLTADAADQVPAWKPDQGWVVFSRMTSDGPRLFRVYPGGGPAVEIPVGETGASIDPDWR